MTDTNSNTVISELEANYNAFAASVDKFRAEVTADNAALKAKVEGVETEIGSIKTSVETKLSDIQTSIETKVTELKDTGLVVETKAASILAWLNGLFGGSK